MARLSLVLTLLSVAVGFEDPSPSAGAQGVALAQLKSLVFKAKPQETEAKPYKSILTDSARDRAISLGFMAAETEAKPQKNGLPYVPVKFTEGCVTHDPDFGPDKHGFQHPRKNLGQHLQVAMEVTCTNFFLRCAYAAKDFSLLGDAIAGGLLDAHATGLENEEALLKQGIISGVSAVYKKGIKSSLKDQEDGLEEQDAPEFQSCNSLPARDVQLKSLREAIKTHFQAYKQSTPKLLRDWPDLPDGIGLAFCDQIGDDGSSACDELMSEAIRTHYGPAVLAEGITSSPSQAKPGVTRTVITAGDGKTFPKKGDKVTMHYTGTLTDGTKFDSSRDRGSPLTAPIGVGRLIKGWDEGVPQMSLGERSKLDISSDFGYGANGSPPKIPPNADLVFDVELLKIN